MSNERIRLVNISKSYYSKDNVTQALRKVNLSFEMGEFVAITGESGSGKSTLLHMIGGMDRFDEGEMYVDGQPTFQYDDSDWEDYRCSKIGYVFQDYSLISHYSVLDNVVGALLVMGKDLTTAREKAHSYIKEVGLEKVENHKASQLSSGQKQRLSIARALAKETGIILADEPTGNLDSETGDQIVELLAKLAQSRLVIMVTHNYDQVEAYASRKIRIHDGEVISDVSLKEKAQAEACQLEEVDRDKKSFRTLTFFGKRNLLLQPARTAMLFIFTLLVAIVALILVAEIASHWDDTYTKKYQTTAFAKEDPTRLVAKKTDGSAFNEEEIEKILSLNHVVGLDTCDYANDVNYYLFRDQDYKVVYGRSGWNSEAEVTDVKFLDDSHFVQSIDRIEESQLTAGRMPESRREIVLATDDKKLLGKSMDMYFSCKNLWDSHYYVCRVQIVGIISSQKEQAYFTREFCHMLTNGTYDEEFRLAYNWNNLMKDFDFKPRVRMTIADDLTGNQMRFASKFPFDSKPYGQVLLRTMDGDQIIGEDQVIFSDEESESTGTFIEVSQEFYDAHNNSQILQLSIYIVSYAKTDEILNKLENMGLYAVSTYRVSTTDYQQKVVKERFSLMGICFGGLFVLALAELLILRALMRGRRKDFDILKFIGLKSPFIYRISHYEMAWISLSATIFAIVILNLLRLTRNSFCSQMMWYVGPGSYLIFALYVNLVMFLTVMTFNRSWNRRAQA